MSTELQSILYQLPKLTKKRVILLGIWLGLLFSPFLSSNPNLKLVSWLGAFLGCQLPLIATQKEITRLQRIKQNYEDLADQKRVNDLFNASVGVVPEEKGESSIQLFDWSRIALERDKMPHFLILGRTGTGKTTFAQWLATQLEDGFTIAVSPHWQLPDFFPTANLIIGANGNLGTDARPYGVYRGKTIGEPELPFELITQGDCIPSVAQFTRSLEVLMESRYVLNPQTYRRDQYQFISVFLDEFPVYASSITGCSDVVLRLLKEARKVGIRLFILTQGRQVKTLGIEGQSDLRENWIDIRLGTFAIDHCESVRNSYPVSSVEYSYWDKVLAFLKTNGDRAAMVDNVPGLVPDLTEFIREQDQQLESLYAYLREQEQGQNVGEPSKDNTKDQSSSNSSNPDYTYGFENDDENDDVDEVSDEDLSPPWKEAIKALPSRETFTELEEKILAYLLNKQPGKWVRVSKVKSNVWAARTQDTRIIEEAFEKYNRLHLGTLRVNNGVVEFNIRSPK